MSAIEAGNLLITGASGQIGQAVCRLLRTRHRSFIAVDVRAETGVQACDLRYKSAISRLFEQTTIGGIIHLAAILPTAFHADPLTAVSVNLSATFELLRESVRHRVRRFVFASSMSVYGTTFDPRPRNEDDPATPTDPYGASKRVIEIIGENLMRSQSIEFVSLRIARVVGLGARHTSSPWRSQIFEQVLPKTPIRIGFAADAFLPIVHVDDIGHELVTLAESPRVSYTTYNSPAETLGVGELKMLLEDIHGCQVELDQENHDGGPLSDGSRFSNEFQFIPKTLSDRLRKI